MSKPKSARAAAPSAAAAPPPPAPRASVFAGPRLLPKIAVAALVVGGAVAVYVATRPKEMVPYAPPELEQLSEDLGKLIKEKLAAANAHRSDPAKQVEFALALHFNNRFVDALPNHVAIAELLPDDPKPLHYQAHCYREFGDPEKAEALYAETARRFPSFAPAHYERGRLALERGDLDLAETCFAEAAKLEPQKFNGWLGLGDVAVRRRDYAKGRELLEKASRLAPEDKTCTYQLGLALRGLGLKAEAERKLAAGSGAIPKKMADAWSERQGEFSRSASDMISTAIGLVRRGRLADGLGLLERLHRGDPTNIEILNNLSAAYQDAKQFDKARDLLVKALARDPGRDATLANLASLELNTGDYKKSLEYSEQAIKTAPTFAPAHFNRANALLRLGRRAEAIAAYGEVIRFDPRNGKVRVALAAAYAEDKKFPQAIKEAAAGVALEPEYLPGRLFQIDLLLQAGDRPAAAAAYAAAKALAPDSPDLRRFEKVFR